MVQVLPAIFMASAAGAHPAGTTGLFNFFSASGWFLEAFAAASLTVSVMLFFWVSARYHRTERDLHQRLNALAVTNAELRQENDQLILALEQLRQTGAGLPRSPQKALRVSRAQ